MIGNGAWLEMAIIVFILIGIGVVIWRGGAANPVGTGKLQAGFRKLGQDVVSVTGRMETLEKSCATGDDLDRLREEWAADRGRIGDLARLVETMHEDFAAMREVQAGRQKVMEAQSESIKAMAEEQRRAAEKQEKIAVDTATTAANVGNIARDLDRLYKVIVPKGMKP